MKNTLSNTVNLFEAVDKLLDTVSSNSYCMTTTGGTNWQYIPNDYTKDVFDWTIGHYDFSPYWETISIPAISTPSYPVANGYFLSNGDLLLEIAVTGFDKDEISIRREDYNLIIKGEPTKEDISDRKELFHTLAKRKFTLKYSIPSKMDLDEIEVKMDKGVLSIRVPIKEEMKPITKEIKIR